MGIKYLGMVVHCADVCDRVLHAHAGGRRQLPPSVDAARGAGHHLHVVVLAQARLELAQQGLNVAEAVRQSEP